MTRSALLLSFTRVLLEHRIGGWGWGGWWFRCVRGSTVLVHANSWGQGDHFWPGGGGGLCLGYWVCVHVIDRQQPMPALLSLEAQMMLGDLPRTWLSELNAWGSRVTSAVAAAVTNPTPRSSPARPVRAGVPGGVGSAYSSMRGGRAPADAMASLQLPTPAGEGGHTTAVHSCLF